MHWKKDLKIETKFFEDDIEGIPDAVLVPPTMEFIRIETGPSDDHDFLARTAAEIMERLLSNRIIENFLSCWQTLKQATLPPTAYRQHHRTSHSSLLSYTKPVEERHQLHHQVERLTMNEDMNSSNVDWLEQQAEGFYCKTKIAQTHVEKARILKDIVEKLKRARKETVSIDKDIVRIKSNHILVSQIKQLQRVSSQLQTDRIFSLQKDSKKANKEEYYQSTSAAKIVKKSKEEEELQKALWVELGMLKEELRGLRLDNQSIIERQFEKQNEIESIKREREELMRRYETLRQQNFELINKNHITRESHHSNYHLETHNDPSFQTQSHFQPNPQNLHNPNLQPLRAELRPQQEELRPQRAEVDLQFKLNYEKQMALLHERIKNMEQREELMRTQLLKELQLRQQYIKSNEFNERIFREELLKAQTIKEQTIKEQLQKELILKESLEREQRLKQQFLKEHAEKERQLREEIRREQEMKQKALREHDQREFDIRQNKLKQISDRENQLREHLLREYKQRDESIRQQENRLKALQNQQQDFLNKLQLSLTEQNIKSYHQEHQYSDTKNRGQKITSDLANSPSKNEKRKITTELASVSDNEVRRNLTHVVPSNLAHKISNEDTHIVPHNWTHTVPNNLTRTVKDDTNQTSYERVYKATSKEGQKTSYDETNTGADQEMNKVTNNLTQNVPNNLNFTTLGKRAHTETNEGVYLVTNNLPHKVTIEKGHSIPNNLTQTAHTTTTNNKAKTEIDERTDKVTRIEGYTTSDNGAHSIPKNLTFTNNINEKHITMQNQAHAMIPNRQASYTATNYGTNTGISDAGYTDIYNWTRAVANNQANAVTHEETQKFTDTLAHSIPSNEGFLIQNKSQILSDKIREPKISELTPYPQKNLSYESRYRSQNSNQSESHPHTNNFMHYGTFTEKTEKMRPQRHYQGEQSGHGEAYGYSTTRTVKGVTQNNRTTVIWHGGLEREVTSKSQFKVTARPLDENKDSNKVPGSESKRTVDWGQEEERNEYCGCCF